ncbi:2,3-bisphosphoglycerate-independent phosphoglycerate mutase [Candidatus Dojkabacteria bacterium]|nr:2,3-bisphosphoglycerate-independent phosphoglycerate mutase [Candidatus Dojkabacteria bacterium]
MTKPLVLIVMDGFGLSVESLGNAIHKADTPNLDLLWSNCAHTTLIRASEAAVGLDQGYTGNSEVGHINMGAGQVIPQNLQLINESIETGSFLKDKFLNELFKKARKEKKRVHFMGVLSNAGVHGHIKHLYKLLEIAANQKVNPYLHLFLDGRDTGEQEAYFFLNHLKAKIAELRVGQIATMTGRFFSMDRNTRWERTEKAYNCMLGIEGRSANDPYLALQEAYKQKETDEIFEPTILLDSRTEKPIGCIEDSDYVLFFNFREDRARQITQAFVQEDFTGFTRKKTLKDIRFVSMVGYAEGLNTEVIFPPVYPEVTVPDVLAAYNLRQMHIAETEKYAHISYFFNGGVEAKHDKELLFRIPSPLVKDYVVVPEMSAYPVKDELITQIRKDSFDFYLVNFANPDMVGHTGDLEAAIKAVEVTDECVGEVVFEILQKGGQVIITSDHGNCESMIDPKDGKRLKSHTLNNVPFIFADDIKKFPAFTKIYKNGPKSEKLYKKSGNLPKVGYPENSPATGILADVGTTVLYLLGITPPEPMNGLNLVEFIGK